MCILFSKNNSTLIFSTFHNFKNSVIVFSFSSSQNEWSFTLQHTTTFSYFKAGMAKLLKSRSKYMKFMTKQIENKTDTKQKWNHKIINYFTFLICIHISLCIRNLKINLSLDPLGTQSQTTHTGSSGENSSKELALLTLHFASHFPNQSILTSPSFLLVHWNCSYQVYYSLAESNVNCLIHLLHLSAVSQLLILVSSGQVEILLSIWFQPSHSLTPSLIASQSFSHWL